MPAPFGPTIPIRSPRWAARNGTRATTCGSVAGSPSGRTAPAPREVADDQVLDPNDDLAGTRGPATGQRRLRQRQPARLARRLAPLRLQPFEPRLVLVHLRELAMAAVALHELLFAGDLLGLRAGVLGRARVAFLALPVIRAVVAAEGREPPVAQLPDPGDGRVQECPVVRRDQE